MWVEETVAMKSIAINEKKCVHSFAAMAGCDRCVRACPLSALTMDDGALLLDQTRCDACGLCQPACPERAITLNEQNIFEGTCDHIDIALLACEKTGLPAGPGVMPCLHALALRDILQLYHSGVRQIFFAAGNCATCNRAQRATTLTTSIAFANTLLASRDRNTIKAEQVGPERWRRKFKSARPTGPENKARRGLLFALGQTLTLTETGCNEATPAYAVTPASQNPAALYAFVPAIDAMLCSGCDACIRLCPHQALSICDSPNTAEDDKAYFFHPQNCTGCNICVDTCTAGAIKITPLHVLSQKKLHLKTYSCAACGNAYHLPKDQNKPPGLCPICQKTNNTARLYQVY